MLVNIKASVALLAAMLTLATAACGAATPASTSKPGAGPPASLPSAGTTAAVEVATNPRLGRILVDRAGRTLYRSSAETAGGIATLTCIGICTATWHPLVLPAGDLQPAAGLGVPGTLGVIARPDGTSQVSWQGSPLYTYVGDTAPGQTNGQGVDHQWSVVKVTGAG